MDLPREIYLNIFQHLNRTELMECSIVCKEWNLPALEFYYHELSYNEFNTHRLISALDRGQQRYFQYCHWVKSLGFYQAEVAEIFNLSYRDSPEEWRILEKEHFLEFLSYLPNLKKLTLTSDYIVKYGKCLIGLNKDRYLTDLEEIHIDDLDCYNTNLLVNNSLVNKILLKAYYKFRTSLKKLTIVQLPKTLHLFIQYGGLLTYLNQFEGLTHLNYYRSVTLHESVTVYQLQVACPNLTTLKFTLRKHILEYEEERNNTFLNTSNLQSLTLSVPRISASYTDMLIHHLPTKLSKLYIHLKDIDFYDWINDIGLERVLKLAKRMSKLPSAEIQCILYVGYDTKSVREVSQMTLFFQVLNAFKGDKEVFCKAEFSASGLAGRSMSYSNGVLDVFYGLKKEYTDIFNEEDFVFDYKLDVPDKTDSIIGPEIFDHLKFSVDFTYNQLTCKILEYSLTNCNYLQYFEFTEMYSACQQLRLYNANDRHFNYYTRKRLQPPTKTEDNLKVVKLKNFIPSDDFLHMLATYLPNIYYFECGGEEARSRSDLEAPPNFINLAGFRKLEIFKLDMNCYSTKFDQRCKLQINYMNDQEKNYVIKKAIYDFRINSDSSKSSVGSSPTLTLSFNKNIKLIQLRTRRGEVIGIKDGVLQKNSLLISVMKDVNYSAYFE